MRVLVTRPREDAEPLAERLHTLGIEAMVEPLLEVTFDDSAAPDLDGVQAILATSANGVRAFASLSARRDIPLLAVGDATARAARDIGFRHFESAEGNVETLARLVALRCDPARGPLLHVAGSQLAGDLAGLLEARGFVYRRAVLYAARPAAALSDAAAAALEEGKLDGVLFFSPRTAETFVSLVRQGKLARTCRRLVAFCLSEVVAERARTIAWRRIAVAAHPDQDTLLTLLADPTQGPWGTMSETTKTPSETAETPDRATAAAIDEEPAAEAAAARAEADEIGEPARPAPARRVSRAAMIPVAALTVVVLAAIGGGALYAAWPFWSPYVARYVKSLQADPLQDPRLGGLPGRVTALEGEVKKGLPAGDSLVELEQKRAEIRAEVTTLVKRVDDLEKSLESVRAMVKATTLPIQAADARKALDELSQRMARLEQTGPGEVQRDLGRLDAENARMAQSVAALTRRMDGLEAARAETTGLTEAARTLVLAAGHLREALRTSAAFAGELAALKKAAGNKPDLVALVNELTPHADKGIPLLATLSDRFGAMASAASAAAHRIDGDDWVAAIANRLASVVTIRRTDGADDTIDGLLAKAEAAMRDGDLIGAVKTLEGLKDGPAEAAASWLKQARARVLAERAMAVLHVQTVSLITPAAK